MPCIPAIKDIHETCLHAEQKLNQLLDHLLQLRPELNPLQPLPDTVSTRSSRSSSLDGSDQLPGNHQVATQLAAVQLLALLRLQNVQLATQVGWLLQAGNHYDHANQQANGFYSWARMAACLQKHTLKKLEVLRAKRKLSVYAKNVQTLYELSILFDYQLHVLRRLSLAYGQNSHLNISQSINSLNLPLHSLNSNNCNQENDTRVPILDDDTKSIATQSTMPAINGDDDYKNTGHRFPLQFLCRPEISEDGTADQLFLEPMRAYVECNTFTIEPRAQVALSLLYGKHGLYWYNQSTHTIFKLLRAMFLVRGARRTPVQVLNTRKCGATLAANCAQATLRFMTDAFQFTELKAYNRLYISLLKLPCCLQYQAHTVQLHAQSEILVPEADKSVQRLPDPVNCRKIRCRLLRGKSQQQPVILHSNQQEKCPKQPLQDTLVFHVHGGGFTITPPDAHEIYLRDWVCRMNGVPILSVDYRRCEQYPCAIQDVLDAYLTITGFSYNASQREDCAARATKTLGFLPRRVLLLGDSCGGSLIMSLLCLLNEMRRLWPQQTPLMPFAICPVYPVFDLRGVVSSSRMLGSFDPILHNGNLLAMHGCYGGMQTEVSDKVPWFLPGHLNGDLKQKRDFNNNQLNWSTEEDVLARFWKVNDRLGGPFASPITYKHLDDLSEVRLQLVGSHICPLLDDSIQMFHKWKGPKALKMFEDLPHGFLQFVDQCKQSRKATQEIGTLIADILQQDQSQTSVSIQNADDLNIQSFTSGPSDCKMNEINLDRKRISSVAVNTPALIAAPVS